MAFYNTANGRTGDHSADCTATKDKWLQTVTAIGLDTDEEEKNGTIPVLNGGEYLPSTFDITIGQNKYVGGNIIIKGDSNLVASNIREGVQLFGLTGTCTDWNRSQTWISSNTCQAGTPLKDGVINSYVSGSTTYSRSSKPSFFYNNYYGRYGRTWSRYTIDFTPYSSFYIYWKAQSSVSWSCTLYVMLQSNSSSQTVEKQWSQTISGSANVYSYGTLNCTGVPNGQYILSFRTSNSTSGSGSHSVYPDIETFTAYT